MFTSTFCGRKILKPRLWRCKVFSFLYFGYATLTTVGPDDRLLLLDVLLDVRLRLTPPMKHSDSFTKYSMTKNSKVRTITVFTLGIIFMQAFSIQNLWSFVREWFCYCLDWTGGRIWQRTIQSITERNVTSDNLNRGGHRLHYIFFTLSPRYIHQFRDNSLGTDFSICVLYTRRVFQCDPTCEINGFNLIMVNKILRGCGIFYLLTT